MIISASRKISGAKRLEQAQGDLTPPVWRHVAWSAASSASPTRVCSRAPSAPSAVSCVASAADISPVSRPSRMVTMRSAIASTSGSSEEISDDGDAARGQLRRGSRAPRPWRRRRCRASARRRSGPWGRSASQRASTTFCWLPPERLPMIWSGPAMRIDMRLAEAARAPRAPCASSMKPRPPDEAVERGDGEILADRQLQEQRLLLAVLRHEADAVADRVARRADAHGLAVDRDACRRRGVGAEDGAGELGAARRRRGRRCPGSRRRGRRGRCRRARWRAARRGRARCAGPAPRGAPAPRLVRSSGRA